ncbi:lysoplasmalogenase [Microbacterium aurum]|uniref:lysoplasmalogenase n=1 Tax=Microbacterium aurum TaxID=36805 RepID=UPI0028E7EA21|nr:lysoplasmalogenase [Microbacterium aurum]
MTLDPAHPRTHPAFADRTRWWGFGLYALVSAIHIVSGVVGPDVIVFPTKLMLMPALAIAALWALRGSFDASTATRAASVLFVALAFSWLGDGAGFFFPFLDDELPAMLLCFGLAHLAYILLFLRFLPRRAVTRWTLIYVVWWVLMVAVLWPILGALAIAVALYGLVLGGTAVAATRGGAITTAGGAFFLASDTILALRLFLPDQTGLLAGPWVMLTYTIGQGLLAYGIVRLLREEPR